MSDRRRHDVVVVGLGYVGLPLAQAAVGAGLSVVGLDASAVVVASLANGRSHVDDLTDEDVTKMLGAGFEPTTDPTCLAEAAAVVVCVPTPLGDEGGPDLAAVRAAMTELSRHLTRDTLVVLESTTYPGTTDEVVRPILETTGLRAGVDFALAFSPERVDPGNTAYGIGNTPKVVGGHTPACTEAACAFYSRFVDTVVPTRGTREAETAKLLENTYRHINIALVNEMARFCHDLDIDLWEVIAAARTKPFGFQAFYPGPGVGGHCIPIDPNYLSHNVRTRLGYPFRFVELAQEINASMPAYVARRVQDALNEDGKALRGARVLLLGVTYKADIADQRESPAVPVARRLLEQGARLSFHDPLIDHWDELEAELGDAAISVPHLEAAVVDADLVVLLQRHRDYDVDALARASRRFLDTRGVVTPSEHAERL
ncbi:UDP-N-acetyl-D-glucosamine dehydrogenase [Terrabacter sp. Soil811]|uniref:nucleotide sugar dehydrogenase n=1 Tax=Terrabacter sp. Soil811 TaxID=1736419 RepID=UPI0006FD5C88|nr:nucleotide sugar dehydrogenase [Terrabacter sp. Soil811]KRF44330.1 UDP-N-acetyl-D-glucosamine dehydrogenase [Terrabacter sp. Soil811]